MCVNCKARAGRFIAYMSLTAPIILYGAAGKQSIDPAQA
jgi:hypothetical protein